MIVRKLALLCINPGHDLVTNERVTALALRGLRAIRNEAEISWKKKAVVGTFLGVFPFLPRRLAVAYGFQGIFTRRPERLSSAICPNIRYSRVKEDAR